VGLDSVTRAEDKRCGVRRALEKYIIERISVNDSIRNGVQNYHE